MWRLVQALVFSKSEFLTNGGRGATSERKNTNTRLLSGQRLISIDCTNLGVELAGGRRREGESIARSSFASLFSRNVGFLGLVEGALQRSAGRLIVSTIHLHFERLSRDPTTDTIADVPFGERAIGEDGDDCFLLLGREMTVEFGLCMTTRTCRRHADCSDDHNKQRRSDRHVDWLLSTRVDPPHDMPPFEGDEQRLRSCRRSNRAVRVLLARVSGARRLLCLLHGMDDFRPSPTATIYHDVQSPT